MADQSIQGWAIHCNRVNLSAGGKRLVAGTRSTATNLAKLRVLKLALVSRYLPPRGGGIGVYTEKTAAALAAAGHEVHVFTAARTGLYRSRAATTVEPDGSTRLVEGGVQVHFSPSSWGGLRETRVIVGARRVARALVAAGPFDVVQACEWEAEAWLYATRPASPLLTRLATPHYLVADLNEVARWEQHRQLLVRRLERLQATRSSFVISPSAALAQRVTADWGLDPERVAVVPTGIAPLRPDAANASLAAQLPKPFVLYFGRLELRKGTREWLDALPVVLARNPGLTALFVGEDMGWRGRSFRDYAKRISGPLWPRFRFHTHLAQTELFPVIANATLVVLPSRWESLSNACLESMSLARPILATRGSAFEELIEHGVSGFLVAPRDPSALAEAACSLLAQPSLLARLGAAAQRRAREFDLEAMVAELVQVYERVAGGWTA